MKLAYKGIDERKGREQRSKLSSGNVGIKVLEN